MKYYASTLDEWIQQWGDSCTTEHIHQDRDERMPFRNRCAESAFAWAERRSVEFIRNGISMQVGDVLPIMRAIDGAWTEPTGLVYLVSNRSGVGPTKLGHSWNVDSRIRGLQTGNPNELWCTWSGPGTPRLERALHALLGEDRHKGEWFTRSSKLGLITDLVLHTGLAWLQERQRNRGRLPHTSPGWSGLNA